jgi:hypothetical protein
MEKLIPINIVGARVSSMGFTYKDESNIPDFAMCIDLIDAQDKRLTSISIRSESWDSNRCEPSMRLLELAASIRKELDILATQHLNRQQKILEAKNV